METISSTRIAITTKIQCWKDAIGGKSRGRVYGTGTWLSTFIMACHPSLNLLL